MITFLTIYILKTIILFYTCLNFYPNMSNRISKNVQLKCSQKFHISVKKVGFHSKKDVFIAMGHSLNYRFIYTNLNK